MRQRRIGFSAPSLPARNLGELIDGQLACCSSVEWVVAHLNRSGSTLPFAAAHPKFIQNPLKAPPLSHCISKQERMPSLSGNSRHKSDKQLINAVSRVSAGSLGGSGSTLAGR
jgi:hypothetical protein